MTMKFKSIASPTPTEGVKVNAKKAVVPNQSMSLREILERFTRGEKLPVGQEGTYDDGPEDLEKMGHADLVDKMEFSDKLKQTQKDYALQEKKKAAKKQAELDKLAVEKLAAEKAAAEKAADKAK